MSFLPPTTDYEDDFEDFTGDEPSSSTTTVTATAAFTSASTAPCWLDGVDSSNNHHASSSNGFDLKLELDSKTNATQQKSKLASRSAARQQQQQKQQQQQQQQQLSPTSITATTTSSVMNVSAADIELGDRIAGGGFCHLHVAQWMEMTVAVKRIFDPVITPELKDEFEREVEFMSMLRHPNIVSILGVSRRAPNLYVVMEFMSRGSVFQLLHQSTVAVAESRLKKMAIDMLRALHYMHERGVVHRDIKTHNCLLDQYFQLKLCDFGLAAYVSSESDADGSRALQGTPPYIAPEVWNGEKYTPAADMYAFGILLWEIFHRDVPFDGREVARIRSTVVDGERPHLGNAIPNCSASLSNVLIDLIPSCWHADPNQRPTAREALHYLQGQRA
jgi:Protein kinase domain